MIGEIKFRNLVIQVQLELGKDNRNFSFTKNHILNKILLFDPVSDSQQESIMINYCETKFDETGVQLTSNLKQTGFGSDEFQKWANYNLENATGTWLELFFKPTTNTVLAHYFKDENLYCFNSLKNFEFFQPVVLDPCTVMNNQVQCNPIANSVEGKTMKYAIVDNSIRNNIIALHTQSVWQDSPIFIDIENGSYTMLAKTVEDGWIAKMDFEISVDVEEINVEEINVEEI